MASFVAMFYVGVTTAQRASSGAQSLVVSSVGSTGTASTSSKVSGLAASSIEIQLGGQMLPTSLQDPNVSVHVLDSTIVGPESESDALIRKAQALFDDPDAAFKRGEIKEIYRGDLARFKAAITHCVISTMRIREA
jgi:hypothetical protein